MLTSQGRTTADDRCAQCALGRTGCCAPTRQVVRAQHEDRETGERQEFLLHGPAEMFQLQLREDLEGAQFVREERERVLGRPTEQDALETTRLAERLGAQDSRDLPALWAHPEYRPFFLERAARLWGAGAPGWARLPEAGGQGQLLGSPAAPWWDVLSLPARASTVNAYLARWQTPLSPGLTLECVIIDDQRAGQLCRCALDSCACADQLICMAPVARPHALTDEQLEELENSPGPWKCTSCWLYLQGCRDERHRARVANNEMGNAPCTAMRPGLFYERVHARDARRSFSPHG